MADASVTETAFAWYGYTFSGVILPSTRRAKSSRDSRAIPWALSKFRSIRVWASAAFAVTA